MQLEELIRELALIIEIRPHRRNRPRCAGCGERGGVYDRLPARRFEFVPLWGIRVFFLYMMRRGDCPGAASRSSRCPGPTASTSCTTTYQWFLATYRLAQVGNAIDDLLGRHSSGKVVIDVA